MFVDLVGSTELSTRLDPEELRNVIAAYHDCVRGVVAHFQGFVARYQGDGELVYFGYPRAHEDDAELAVRAGLGIVEAVSGLATTAGPSGSLNVRIGISTGIAVVGDLLLSGASIASEVVGDTPNLAARLQTLAEPGCVVIDATTKRLVGRLFELQQFGPVRLKGLSTPLTVWGVVGESDVGDRFHALRDAHTPLVDRIEEIAVLSNRWEETKAGEGRAVLISGEPGIGKSRIIAALEEHLQNEPDTLVKFICSPHHKDTPLHPIVRQLAQRLHLERSDAPSDALEKLRRALGADQQSIADLTVLANLLSIPVSAEVKGEIVGPRRRREMTLEAILRQLRALSRRAPALVVFEDIHWADPTSLDLLDMLVEHVDDLPILVVVTSRPEMMPGWTARPHVTTLMLSGLPREHASSLIDELTGVNNLPEAVVNRIIAGADGIPLFIEELTKSVIERDSWGSDRLVSEPLTREALPTTLQALLMERLDRLTTGKEAAQIGAVIGREFSFQTLLALSGIPFWQLEAALAELVETGLVFVRGRPPDATYAFKHSLVQDAAYGLLLRERRRDLHRRFAELLEREAAGFRTTEPELIAWHFGEGGVPDKAIHYYQEAAERVTGRFALAEMVNQLRKALHHAGKLPFSKETARRELDLQIALGRALIDHHGSGSEEVRATFERARELCHTLKDVKQLVRVHDGLVNHYFTHSQANEVFRHAEEMLDVSHRTQDSQAFLVAKRDAGLAYLLLGNFEAARQEIHLALETYEPERDGPGAGLTSRDPKVSMSTVLGICLTAMGDLEAGTAAASFGIEHADRLGHVISLVLGLRRACVQRIMQRDIEGAMQLSARLLAMDTEYQTFLGTREGLIFNNWARLHSSRDSTLLAAMQRSVRELDAARHWVMLPFFMANTGAITAQHGNPESALHLLDRASQLIAETGECWYEAEVLRLRAELLEEPERAASLLQAALQLARRQKAKLWELRAATSLARLWARHGCASTARDILAPIVISLAPQAYADVREAEKVLNSLQ
jgi:class 3 adenylate cyclase/predicted ATPase